MKKRILMVATSLALALSMLATGCGNTDKTPGTNTPAPTGAAETNAPAAAGGKITINLGSEPPRMNPILSTDSTSGNVQRHVFEGLTKLGKDGKPIPGVAEKWEKSADGLKYTFTLRDAKWSDGSAITADDFKYSILTLLKKDTAAEYAYLGYYIKGGEAFNTGKGKEEDVGVKVLDPKKLEITLEKPAPFLLDLLAFHAFMPVKKDFYEKQDGGKKYGAEPNTMLYNGPYTISSWQHEDNLVLTKNPNYWNAKEIKLDEVKMMMIKDSNTILNTFKAGEIDMVGLTGDQVTLLKGEGKTPVNYYDGSTWYFEFNTADPLLKNLNIRKALAGAIDRNAFITGVLKNNSKPAYSFTNPVIFDDKGGSFAATVGAPFVKDNDPEAKALFEKGLKELGLDKAPKVEMIGDDSDTARKNMQAFQEMWKKNLGLEVTLTNLPFQARLDRMTNKQFSIVMAGWSADYNDPISFLDLWETTNGNNHTNYSNPNYDKLVKDVQNEADAAKRMASLRELEKIAMTDLPVAPIYFRARDYITNPKLKGVVRTFGQDIDLYWAYLEK